MPAFTNPTAGYTISDLASCSFPLTVLAQNEVKLSGRYYGGNTNLLWDVNDNTNVSYYEIQRSDDGDNFTSIAQINPGNTGQGELSYSYKDAQSGYSNPKYYRVRAVLNSGLRIYSNVVVVIFDTKLNLLGKPSPNPFVDHINVNVQLKSANNIVARLTDQSGRVVYQQNFSGLEGENKIAIENILHLLPGIYILELSVDNESMREKVVKR
jgi:hypothetical protein